MKQRLIIAFQVLVAVAIFWVLIRQIDPDQLRTAIATANPMPMFIAFVFLWPGLFMRSWRLQVICNYNAKRHMTAWQAWVVTLVGNALNLIMPGSAGEVVRAYYAYLYTGDKDGMLVASVLDKFAALVSLFAIGAVACFLAGLVTYGVIIGLAFAVLMVLFLEERLIPWKLIERFLNAVLKAGFDASKMKAIWRLPQRLRALVFVQSTIGWLLTYVSFYGIILSFSSNMTFANVLLVTPIINLMPFVPISVAGLGVQEGGITWFLSAWYGIPTTTGTLIAFVYRLMMSILVGIWGLYFIVKMRGMKAPVE